MSTTTTNVHNVVSIALRVDDHGNFKNHVIAFVCDDGSRHEFSAFAETLLSVAMSPVRVVQKATEAIGVTA